MKNIMLSDTDLSNDSSYKESMWWNGECMEIHGTGENVEAEPVELKWVVGYSMLEPQCPKCKEMPYSTSYCMFCGQRFIIHEPTEEERRQAFEEKKKNIKGATWNEKFFACDNCGEDIEKSCSWVGHFDGVDDYGEIYVCKCGKNIHVGHSRYSKW